MARSLLLIALPFGFAVGGAVAFLTPGLLRRHSRPFRNAVAAVSAAGAALAGTTATGLAGWDHLLAAALAAGATVLGARASLRVLTASSIAAAALATGADVQPAALATAGFALAIVLTARKAPGAAPVLAALVVQVVLRLDLPGPHGTSAVAASLVLLVLSIDGYRAMRRRTRRITARIVAAVAGVTVAFAALGAIAFAAARPSLEVGVKDAGVALTAARKADQDTASAKFRSARASFSGAGGSLGAAWARPSWLVPVIGPHLRALDAVAESGEELAASGIKVAQAADLGGIRIVDGTVPIDEIRALEPQLAAAADTVTRSRARLASARSDWLLPPVGRRFDTQVERLAQAEGSLTNSREVLRILPGLLGADGPRRYFLAVQTPSELRGSGGFFGNYGEIVTDNGKITMPRFGRLHELNEAGNPATRQLTGPADYLARYGRFEVARTWQNVTMSPDWPSVTEVISGLYPQSGGAPIDGAIAVDPAGMAALLRLTGPLQVPGWPEPLTPDNAERILLHDQYVELDQSDERIDFLGDTADRLFAKLTTGDLPQPSRILDALGPAVDGKHLQFASLHDGERRVLERLDVAGAMAPVRGDSVALIAQNASPSKVDWFLRRSLAYDVSVDPTTSALEATLTATLRNEAPATGLPPVVIGNGQTPPLPLGTSRLYVSVYSPWLLRAARIDGEPATLESEQELGRNVYSAFVDIPPGGTVAIELDLAGWYDGDRYHLDVHRQPTVHPDIVDVEVNGARVVSGVEQSEDLSLERPLVAGMSR